MGVKQFLGIKWINGNPQMLFYDNITHSIQYEDCNRNHRNKKDDGKTLQRVL